MSSTTSANSASSDCSAPDSSPRRFFSASAFRRSSSAAGSATDDQYSAAATVMPFGWPAITRPNTPCVDVVSIWLIPNIVPPCSTLVELNSLSCPEQKRGHGSGLIDWCRVFEQFSSLADVWGAEEGEQKRGQRTEKGDTHPWIEKSFAGVRSGFRYPRPRHMVRKVERHNVESCAGVRSGFR